MAPPEAEGMRHIAGSPKAPPAVSVLPPTGRDIAGKPAHELAHQLQKSNTSALLVIAQRKDFLKAASARRQGTASFLLQARDRRDGDPQTRIGFTASKKIGNAVMRNRAKRRLREVVRAVLPGLCEPGWDYVLVGRPGVTVDRDFAALKADLAGALRQVHRKPSLRE